MYNVLCPGEMLIDFVATYEHPDLYLKKAGGAPANVACAINKFGCNANVLATVGDDNFGEFLISNLTNNNLSTEFILKSKITTTLAFVSLDCENERSFEFVRGADAQMSISDFSKFKNYDLFHFASATAFLGGELGMKYDQLLNYAIENNIKVSFDMNYRDALFPIITEEYLSKCRNYISKSDIIKLSEEELLLLTNIDDRAKAIDVVQKLTSGIILISLGAEGSILIYNNEQFTVPSIKVQVNDTTGAGDAFIGAFIGSYLRVKDITTNELIKCVEFANIAGALTTTKLGAFDSIPTLEEVNNYSKD